MIYDPTVENIPVNWAKSCPTGHNPKRGGMGENIYWRFCSIKPTLSKIAISSAVSAWYSEVKIFPGSSVSKMPSSYGSIGHYT